MVSRSETFKQLFGRKSKNMWTQSVGLIKRSALQIRANMVQADIEWRKREFGVYYLKLLEKGASDKELEGCISRAQVDIEKLTCKLSRFNERIKEEDIKMKTHLVKKPRQLPPQKPVQTFPIPQAVYFDEDSTNYREIVSR